MTTPEVPATTRPRSAAPRDDAGPFDLAALARLDEGLRALAGRRSAS